MADINETALLTFEIDQGQAEQSLVKTEKALLSLKKQQNELNKEYKEGKISEDEYVKSNLKLQQSVKKETDQKNQLNKLLNTEANSRDALRIKIATLTREYNGLNTSTAAGAKRSKELERELKSLNEELNKGSKASGSFKDNIGNYPEQLGAAAKSVNVAGTSVGGLTDKLKGFTPATAAVGAFAAVVGGLASAYASSATGARDLALAQSTLSASAKILSEDLANLISSSEDGEGILTTLTNAFLFYVSPSLAIASNQIATLEQQIKDLEVSRAFAAGFAKDDERRAEILRRIRDDEEKSLEERLKASEQIDGILESSGERTAVVIQAQINAIKNSTVGYEKNRDAQLQVAQLTAEIADKEEEITGKLTENVKARKAISDEIQALARANRRQQGAGPSDSPDPLTNAFQDQAQVQGDFDARLQKDRVAREKQANDEIVANRRKSAELQKEIELAKLDFVGNVLGTLSTLYSQNSKEGKLLASASALINTYLAATAALASGSEINPIFGIISAAAAIANGLASVAKINGVEFAEGGYTGPGTKYQPAGIVHAGEVVWSQKDVAMAGGPAAANALRPTSKLAPYADGGFVTNQNISASQQSLIMANMIKNLPVPVLGVEEVTRVQKRIAAREKVARI